MKATGTDRNRRRALLSWLALAALVVLCGVLGLLQYRWLGEVSRAERDRLRSSLQASLYRLSQDFNAEITSACVALLPDGFQAEAREEDYAAGYLRWKASSRHDGMFRRIAVVRSERGALVLRSLDLESGTFSSGGWPAGWSGLKERLTARISGEAWREQRPQRAPAADEGMLVEIPRFRRFPPGGPPPPLPFGRPEGEWLIFELNPDYIREVLLPEVLRRHLGISGSLDYQVEVVTRTSPPLLIYQSDPGRERIGSRADASAGLFELQYERIVRRWARGGGPRELDRGRGPGPDWGRWQMLVRHHAGSLEAVVSQARWRNLAVTGAVLILMLAAAAALIRFTRQAQQLADLQMEFVAGVSHEFRTPLTVIRTAAYNLRGRLAHNAVQVERYGALIQNESRKLTDLVEQVLTFASARAGYTIRESEPLSVEALIDECIESSRSILDPLQCTLEKKLEPDLPLVMGDAAALKQALQNLIANAAKYGMEGERWIGVSASRAGDVNRPLVEIRVRDRGPGIEPEEQAQIFDPFFRGRRALQNQIHGTGLGLSLVKGIMEAHGGAAAVRSQPGKGAEFVLRLPAAPVERQDEFANSADRG